MKKPRTTSGRYPRGEETKQRIIATAIDIFGRQGFVGTSTRDIAAAAGVNTPAIQYYFDSKLGLYKGCMDQLSARVWQALEPAVTRCGAVVAGNPPLEDIITCIGDVQNSLLDTFFVGDDGNAIRRLLAWEDAENEASISDQMMRDRIAMPLIETFRIAIDRVTKGELKPVDVDMHAMALMGVSMFFHFNQSRVMDMLNWTANDDFLDRLKVVAQAQLRYALVGLSAEAR
ncbi:hypothetical protein ASG11_04465 [Sphingomonas sp. Leaf357]|uniref:TetR/AcrR family transcriptional regulator n=1 Tax=Sphingomonas sp. Leaf357 TaxID=1736350 RepID=UPI00070080E0|nr:TetR/AcrR family transcriptional regulator [Sphingomonas sp. Leaf357]KQS03596.1 hypothetical protein ASG11_04465 [Sphingomonas sp. Leaf357]